MTHSMTNEAQKIAACPPKPTKPDLQVLLKWSEGDGADKYWYVIRRGLNGMGYTVDGYLTEDTGKNVKPEMCVTVDQDFVAEEFRKQGKEWVRE